LLLEHLVKDGDDPVLEGAVVCVGDDEVADAVEALAAEFGAGGAEGADVGVCKTLDEVFLDTSGSGDNGGDVAVFNEPAEDASEPG
jgi:hypothetical protein